MDFEDFEVPCLTPMGTRYTQILPSENYWSRRSYSHVPAGQRVLEEGSPDFAFHWLSELTTGIVMYDIVWHCMTVFVSGSLQWNLHDFHAFSGCLNVAMIFELQQLQILRPLLSSPSRSRSRSRSPDPMKTRRQAMAMMHTGTLDFRVGGPTRTPKIHQFALIYSFTLILVHPMTLRCLFGWMLELFVD